MKYELFTESNRTLSSFMKHRMNCKLKEGEIYMENKTDPLLVYDI